MNKKNLLTLVATLLLASCSAKLAQIDSLKKTNEDVVKTSAQSANDNKTVFFATNRAELDGSAQEVLKDVVIPWLKENPKLKVKVEAYCDERGTVAYNKKLGKLRAIEVKKYLVKNGIKSSHITVVSFGKSNPIDEGHEEKAWAKNRRAVTISAQ